MQQDAEKGRDPVKDLAEDYFQTVAGHFPVMCASDEFYSMPRAQAASHYPDRMDDFSPAAVNACLDTVRGFRKRAQDLAHIERHPEKRMDLGLLVSSMSALLMDLTTRASWRHNPLMYLKVAFIGVEQALGADHETVELRQNRITARLHRMKALFSQAVSNLEQVPEHHLKSALAMVDDGCAYLAQLAAACDRQAARKPREAVGEADAALKDFGRFLKTLAPACPAPFDSRRTAVMLQQTLAAQFLCPRPLEQIQEIAREEWRLCLEELERLQTRIDPGRSWRQIYAQYRPPQAAGGDLFTLYGREIEHLKQFFSDCGLVQHPVRLELRETPVFLRSVRGSGSFSAALGADNQDKDFFYLTTRMPAPPGSPHSQALRKRLHREYRFLCAHETFPGHHLLDTIRRRLANPVRRQIESALFYEGWASHAETMLIEYGYAEEPIDSLMLWKRRLWRAARCLLDVGLNTGTLAEEDAIRMLVSAGLSPAEAGAQVKRFRLNPGYQLCYTLGRYEIKRLADRFGPQMGRDRFYAALLKGGQLPFDWVEQRLENTVNTGPDPGKEAI